MSKELTANTTLSHYQIVFKIGAGGMGEVYLAQDTKLDRKVALKLLPTEFAEDAERMRRFVQEAKASSALNHPNIITIHEIGEVDGTHFIATEYIEGETLSHRLRSESLSIRATLEIAIQIASALQAAHNVGVVHRDVKPENVMIRPDGVVKVLDFGIAKLSEPPSLGSGSDRATDEEAATAIKGGTTPGVIIGTARYMSPEQARGKPVDARTDIFSFGVVLYEMLTAREPFAGETAMDVMGAILHKEPTPIRHLLPDLPPDIERLINKTLRKDREQRYQTAKDLLIDLKDARQELELQDRLERTAAPNREEPKTQSLSATTAAASQTTSSAEYVVSEIKNHKRVVAAVLMILLSATVGIGYWFLGNRAASPNNAIGSIAVLPFQNRSSDPDTEYLSDGLAESLIYRLSQLPNLKVSPTSSVFRYKGKETDPQKIGSELGVSAVLSGRIVQRGDNLTISVELVDVRNNTLLWGEQYDRKMSDLLATQREIATTITQKLQLRLGAGDAKGITKRYTDSNEGYQLYLKGRFHFAKRTKDDIQRGIDYFQQAIKLDPNFALAYARIAESYVSMPAYPYLSPKEAVPQAKAAAKRALEIDPTLAEAHTFLAYALAIYDWNWVEAEREFKRGIELDANNSPAHFRYGQIYLAAQGRSDEAIAEVKQALEIEPLDLNMGGNLSWIYFSARQYDRALEQGKKTYELDTNFVTARWNVSNAYIGKGMYTEAIAINEKALQTDPTSQFALHSVGYAYARSGRRQEAEEVIKRFREIAKSQYTVSYWIATIYAALDDKDKAFAELENSLAEHDFYLHRLKVDPFWDPLREDPRFKEMLKRLNLSEI